MAEPPDRLPGLRASDADRERAVEHLRAHAGEGRLTVEELSERLGGVYEARTAGELERLTADLPDAVPPQRAPAARERSPWVVAVMSGASRKGRFRVGPRTQAVAVMGAVDIDLRQAQYAQAESIITATAIMGSVEVTVPPGVEVEVTGFALMGANDSPRESGPIPPGAPVVRVRAFSLMGAVDVKRRERKR